MESNKSTNSLPWPQIVTEIWTEPQSSILNIKEIDLKNKVTFNLHQIQNLQSINNIKNLQNITFKFICSLSKI